jgi:protein TonB
MFTHLIESGSHKRDMARRGRFFLGTLALYGLLLVVAGVASVYAYDSHLGTQNLERYMLVAIPLAPHEPQRPGEQRRAAGGGGDGREIFRRADRIAPLFENYQPPSTISTERNRKAELPRHNETYASSNIDVDPVGGGGGLNLPDVGGGGGRYPGHGDRDAVVVPIAPAEDPLPPPRPTPAPVKTRQQIRLSSHVISSKILSKPAPLYPSLARQARIQGAVTVEILVDEQGRVVSAQATNGPPLLRAAAQQSAYQARFSPTTISGQPVKVSGVITYNFILQ